MFNTSQTAPNHDRSCTELCRQHTHLPERHAQLPTLIANGIIPQDPSHGYTCSFPAVHYCVTVSRVTRSLLPWCSNFTFSLSSLGATCRPVGYHNSGVCQTKLRCQDQSGGRHAYSSSIPLVHGAAITLLPNRRGLRHFSLAKCGPCLSMFTQDRRTTALSYW